MSKIVQRATRADDDAVMYGKDDGVSNLLLGLDMMMDDAAKEVRFMLDLPPGDTIKNYDMDVNFVLMYLMFCSDYATADTHLSQDAGYDHASAVFDLDTLLGAINKVRAQINAARKKEKQNKKSGKKEEKKQKAKGTVILKASDFEDETEFASVTIEPTIKPERIVLGKKGA